ncbi:MAG TPA: adenylosuccinate lyase [Desulfomonilia bacterium]|jgi:adenylosuccinate lyase
MIPRYSTKVMNEIWSDQNRYRKWLDVEIAACEAWAKLGKIPQASLENIRKNSRFDVARIEEIENITKHDVIAFVSCVAEYIGEDARYVHMGLTSSDVLDTAYALQCKEAGAVIIEDMRMLMEALKKRAYEYKDLPAMGRSHGIHAEPVSFGSKFALWYAEMGRNLKRMNEAIDVIACGKISGAVGTFANVPPEVEEYVCAKLGLTAEPLSTQIVQRDRHAQFFTTIALIGCTIEKIAIEIRHLQRTEVLEAMEPFGKGQKGSSAMPHKKNPILSENLTGMARLLRGYALSAMENVALWHERDISHSSVERVIGPDATTLLDFALKRLKGLIEGLVVFPENVKKNLELTKGLWHSQNVLLALVDAGMLRDDAYAVVQRNALPVWEGKGDFKEALLNDPEVTAKLSREKIDDLFDLSHHMKYIDTIFKRVFDMA